MSIEKDFAYAKNHPLAEAYRRYSPPPHEPVLGSDQCALRGLPGAGYFGLSKTGQVTVGDDGVTKFVAADKGPHRFLTVSRGQILRCREAFTFLASQPPTTAHNK